MTKKEMLRAFNKFTRSALRWKLSLRLYDWTIGYECHDTNKNSETGDSHLVTAEVDYNPQYFSAWIDVYAPNLMGMKDRTIDKIALHEMLHVSLSPLLYASREMVEALPKSVQETWSKRLGYANEQVISFLSNAFWDQDEEIKKLKEKLRKS